MRRAKVQALSIVIALLIVLALGGLALAQGPTIGAGATQQTFVSATSAPASCTNPPGPCGPLTSLPLDLKADSLLTITFSARGTVFQPTTAIVETQIACKLDGTPCEPDVNSVEFLYPAFCCDTRSFTWAQRAGKGAHTLTIEWTTANQGFSLITNRTLVVQAAKL